jgi:drug efflux transport system permease protein
VGFDLRRRRKARSASLSQSVTRFHLGKIGPPLAILSGATTPIEAMPSWLQPVTSLNPIEPFAIVTRGIMLKGTGLQVLYPQLLALALIAVVTVSVNGWGFRRQLT